MIYADDGSAAPPPDVAVDTFWRSDLREAADHLVPIIREVQPQVLVTYDDFGNYGHPDHVQAHRVAMYASQLAAVPSYRLDLGEPWTMAKIYWVAMAESWMREGLRRLRDAGDTQMFEGMDPDGPLPPFITPDELITTRIDGDAYVDQKMAAMQAHATQIAVDGPFFALSNNAGNQVWGTEFYRLAVGELGPRDETTGLESDLFSGLD
jgi:N-acetyl-1-D-myo-inositol-2-amino-2-deoxy-alpha-D-glucopyranoside deacetylase